MPDWGNSGEVAAFMGALAAITAIITALGKIGVDIVTAAMDRNTRAVVQGNTEAAASNAIKVAGIQEQLRATPGATPITPSMLPAAPVLQDPAVQQAAIKLLEGTGDGGVKPSEEELRELIREEILSEINAPRANPDRPQLP